MLKIKRHKQRRVPSLNMASMPDLIFTVLFFFMIVTHMRSETPKLQVETPAGKELTKPANKRTIVNLYIGTDSKGQIRIQIGDKIVALEQVGPAMLNMQGATDVFDESPLTVNIRADKHTPMGVVTDVKQELRKHGILTIRYNATEENK